MQPSVDVTPGTQPPEPTPVTPIETIEELRGPLAALVVELERGLSIPSATSFRTIPVWMLDAQCRQLSMVPRGTVGQIDVSTTHLIAHAVARAASQVPQIVGHFEVGNDAEPTVVRSGIHLGIGVDTTLRDGKPVFLVPVMRHAGKRDFADFIHEYERLIDLAHHGSLTTEDLSGATMTVTNPGVTGTLASLPRLMTGQGVVVASGALGYPIEYSHLDTADIQRLGVARVMTLTGTYDHRVIQGAECAEFLAYVEALLSGYHSFYEDVFESLGVPFPPPPGPPRQVALKAIGVADQSRPQRAPRLATGPALASDLKEGSQALPRGVMEQLEKSREVPTGISMRTIPAWRVVVERQRVKAALSEAGRGEAVSFTQIIVYAIARAATEMPHMAAHFERDSMGNPTAVHSGVNLAVIVDLRRDDGRHYLLAPVIRNAGRHSFSELRAEYERLVERARTRQLTRADLNGGTITVSNIGTTGNAASAPRILMPGQGTMVLVGAIDFPAQYKHLDDLEIHNLGVSKVVTMNAICDRRIIQDAEAGAFLARVEALLGGADGFYQDLFSSLGLPQPEAAAPDISIPLADGPDAPTSRRDR